VEATVAEVATVAVTQLLMLRRRMGARMGEIQMMYVIAQAGTGRWTVSSPIEEAT